MNVISSHSKNQYVFLCVADTTILDMDSHLERYLFARSFTHFLYVSFIFIPPIFFPYKWGGDFNQEE